MKCISSKNILWVLLMMGSPACGMQQEKCFCSIVCPQECITVILSTMTEDQALEYIERFANDMRCSVADYCDGRCGKNAQIYAKRVVRHTEALLSGVEWATHPSATEDSKRFWISFFINAYDVVVEESNRAKKSALCYHKKVLQQQALVRAQVAVK